MRCIYLSLEDEVEFTGCLKGDPQDATFAAGTHNETLAALLGTLSGLPEFTETLAALTQLWFLHTRKFIFCLPGYVFGLLVYF